MTQFRIEWDEPGEGVIRSGDPRMPALRFSLDDADRELANFQKAKMDRVVSFLNSSRSGWTESQPMTKLAFPRPLTEKTAQQAKHAILRGALKQMRRVNPRSEEPGETYEGRLLSLRAENEAAYHLFMHLAEALDRATEHRDSREEYLRRQRARDWLDALDAYLDRKYPLTEKPCQTEPSAPAGAKGTSGAPTPPPAADAAASASGSVGSTGSGPDDRFGREQVWAACVEAGNIALARKRLPFVQSFTAGTGLSSLLGNLINELEAHRDALKRAGLLKP